MSDYWIPPDERWVHERARFEMIGYKPPEITAEMIGVYALSDPDPLNEINNPHQITAAAISGFAPTENEMKPAQQKAVTETQQKVIDGLNETLRLLEEAKKSMSMNVPGYSEIIDRHNSLRKQLEELRDAYGQPSVDVHRTHFIVWNEAKTEGFVTTDQQLAYEVRKSASTNCYDKEGNFSHVAQMFCQRWTNDNCTIETVQR